MILLIGSTKGGTQSLAVFKVALPESIVVHGLTRHPFPRNVVDVTTRHKFFDTLQPFPIAKQFRYCHAVFAIKGCKRFELRVSALADSLLGSDFWSARKGTIKRDLHIDPHEALLSRV